MALKYKTPEELEWERKARQWLWGKNTYRGALASIQVPYYEKKLAEARSWLATNPQNTARQREVAYLEKELEEWKKVLEVYD